MKTNLMHYLSSVCFVNQPLHVSGISVAHHQEVYCIYTTTGACCALIDCLLAGQVSFYCIDQGGVLLHKLWLPHPIQICPVFYRTPATWPYPGPDDFSLRHPISYFFKIYLILVFFFRKMKNSSNCMISNTKQCHTLNLKLSRRLNAIQYSPTSSCVSWLNGLVVSELSQFNLLITNAEMVLEKSVYSPSNHVTSLLAREYFIECGIPVCLYRNGTADDSACHVKKLFFLNTPNEFFFDVLLTVHFSTIVAINQLNAQNFLL